MGLIDISKILILKPIDIDNFLLSINNTMNSLDPLYPVILLLANIFAYLFILLFMFCVFIVLRSLKRRIRKIFS